MIDASAPVTQEQFAALVGVSQQAVSELLTRGILTRELSCGEWLLAYCGNLREQAAGRATKSDLDLATERARLAAEQADRIAMQNEITRREMAPVSVIEETLARVGRQIAAILEAIPVQIKLRVPALTADDVNLINNEIARARNLAAAIEIDVDDLGGDAADLESDPHRLKAA